MAQLTESVETGSARISAFLRLFGLGGSRRGDARSERLLLAEEHIRAVRASGMRSELVLNECEVFI